MDRGEIEVEEERRARAKHMPVLPTDSEKRERKSTHVASRGQCKTEDSRNRLEIKSSLPRVGMERGFLARSTDADLVMSTMLIQNPRNVVETHQESHEAPEPHAVNCALENLGANGLCRVLLKRSVESDAQTFVDTDWVGRGERTMAEKSSKCLHQSSGAGENDVRKIESSAKTDDPMLPEEFGCRAQQHRYCSAVGCWMCDAYAPSVREASPRAYWVEDEKIQRCIDTEWQNSGSWR